METSWKSRSTKKYQKKDCFRSFLAPWMKEYIQLKGALNYSIDSIGYALAQFDLYLRIHHIRTFGQLLPSVFLDWIEEEALERNPRTVESKVCIIKGFLNHLLRLELIELNLCESLLVVKPFQYIPYVFSRDEIKKILKVAHTQIFESKNYYFARWAHYAIISTIYACGLRISECLNVKGEDISWDERTLFIRDTKFGKSRIIPFHSKVAEILQNYHCTRMMRFPSSSRADWFFVSYKNKKYHRNTISSRFETVVKKAEICARRHIRGRVMYGGPTIHSLRHSFAIHRLIRWYEEGINPTDKLHLLSTYMGHYKYEYTHHYLRLCRPLRRITGNKFAQHFDTLLWLKGQEGEKIETE